MDESAKSNAVLSDEGRYRLLVEAVTDYAIYMLDAHGRVSSWNPGAQRFKGYAEAEILGHHFSRFYTDEDRATGLPERALATAACEGRFEHEGWRVRKDGTRFWAHVVIDPIRDAAGQLIGYAKITRDLTERRAAEETLKRSEEQFRILVQGVTDYAIYMLDADGRVSSWNAGAERIKGYAEGEIIGKHFSQFYRAEDRALGQPVAALAAAAREGRYESEGWRVRKDGSQFWANVVVDAIRDASGKIIGYAKVTRDVTAKREAQHALEEARETLFQSQKLDAIGQLTGGVAHDFNNLLMVILSSLALIGKRLGDGDPRLHALLDNAVQAAKRGSSLTQRMLSFARRQDLKPVAVDMRQLVYGMSDLLRRSIGPHVTIKFSMRAAMHRVRVDPNQLELALLNLVVNARDAMPNGGLVTVSAIEKQITTVTPPFEPGGYVGLCVTDTGTGMDAATLARAAEPFFTTKGVGKGTGLGLSMVEGLASQSGGRLLLKSEPGVGTTAELWLPVAPEDASVDIETPTASDDPTGPRIVLVVDDDSLVLTNTAAMLEDLGHTALTASSARDALTLLQVRGDVQLLLTDQAMPQMTGTELITQLHQQQPELICILATGYAEMGVGLPADVVRLAKPFDQNELAAAIAIATEA